MRTEAGTRAAGAVRRTDSQLGAEVLGRAVPATTGRLVVKEVQALDLGAFRQRQAG